MHISLVTDKVANLPAGAGGDGGGKARVFRRVREQHTIPVKCVDMFRDLHLPIVHQGRPAAEASAR